MPRQQRSPDNKIRCYSHPNFAERRYVMRKPLLLLAILAALTWTRASYGDPTSLIAFTSGRDGNTDIYVMNADGSDPHRVADSGSSHRS